MCTKTFSIKLRGSPLDDSDAIIFSNRNGKCALHLVAEYFESLELLQEYLQIYHKMTKKLCKAKNTMRKYTPLGLLCSRPYFPAFDKMVLCLTDVNSEVESIYDGMISCILEFDQFRHQDVAPGSRGERSLILLRNLMEANLSIMEYDDSQIFEAACSCLRGALGVSVLSLFFSKNKATLKIIANDCLPIYTAAAKSCVAVLIFLHETYPESISKLRYSKDNLFHAAFGDLTSDVSEVNAKARYICDQCPALICLKDAHGDTVRHDLLSEYEENSQYNLDCVRIICDKDSICMYIYVYIFIRVKRTPHNKYSQRNGQLPLHCFLQDRDHISEVSDEGDCFRLLLGLYPAAAGIKDYHLLSPHDMAVSTKLSPYFIRLLISADPAIDPVERCNLNYEARRQAMFLAFRALSSNVERTVWAKLHLKGRGLLQRLITYLKFMTRFKCIKKQLGYLDI
jgi:hypothetical protein